MNGAVAEAATPEELASAIAARRRRRRVAPGDDSRWFADNAERLRIDGSLDIVVAAYAEDVARG